jgi:hypothetical protein
MERAKETWSLTLDVAPTFIAIPSAEFHSILLQNTLTNLAGVASRIVDAGIRRQAYSAVRPGAKRIGPSGGS